MALVSKLIWAYCRDCRNGRGPRGDGAGDRVLDGTIHLVTLFPLARRWCAAPFGSRPGFHCSMGMPLAVMRSRVTHVDARYPRVFWFSLSGGTLLGKDVGFFSLSYRRWDTNPIGARSDQHAYKPRISHYGSGRESPQEGSLSVVISTVMGRPDRCTQRRRVETPERKTLHEMGGMMGGREPGSEHLGCHRPVRDGCSGWRVLLPGTRS